MLINNVWLSDLRLACHQTGTQWNANTRLTCFQALLSLTWVYLAHVAVAVTVAACKAKAILRNTPPPTQLRWISGITALSVLGIRWVHWGHAVWKVKCKTVNLTKRSEDVWVHFKIKKKKWCNYLHSSKPPILLLPFEHSYLLLRITRHYISKWQNMQFQQLESGQSPSEMVHLFAYHRPEWPTIVTVVCPNRYHLSPHPYPALPSHSPFCPEHIELNSRGCITCFSATGWAVKYSIAYSIALNSTTVCTGQTPNIV